ncbi:hypothetical protein [Streptomyces sp. NPDC059783]|uniref:hypothetical protein n=1 Tax=Streptomyces sp. NPDC059783 TaxID=3346944 RepID=UPI0036504DCF
MLRSLRAGGTATSAAEAAGISPQSLSQAARSDSELRAALDGAPEAIQVIAPRGDWLAALVRLGGDQKAAALAVGINPNQPNNWRQRDPKFNAAVVALLTWIQEAGVRPVRARRLDGRKWGVTVTELDEAAGHLERGASIVTAARLVGVSRQTLPDRAADSPRLAAALEARRQQVVTEAKLTAAAQHIEEGASITQAAEYVGVARGDLVEHVPNHDRLRTALESHQHGTFPGSQ